MAKVQMSMSRVLSELKTYDKRIRGAIMDSSFIAFKANNMAKVGTDTPEEVESRIKASKQSVDSLIENKKRLEAIKVASNAVTKVIIAGVEYTVADVIKRQSDIEYDKLKLDRMISRYNEVTKAVERHNEQVRTSGLNQAMSVNFQGDKSARDSEEVKKFSEDYIQKNSCDYIDPLKIKDEIDKLRKEIDDFVTEVDGVLSEVNAKTVVEIDFVD